MRTVRTIRTIAAVVALAFIAPGTAHSQTPTNTGWQRSDVVDSLRQTSYTRFVLSGRYLVAPSIPKIDEPPELVVQCSPGLRHQGSHWFTNGKFLSGFLNMGMIANRQFQLDQPVVPVAFRLDDGKLQTEYWPGSTDYSSAFFGLWTFENLLYGHALPHRDNTSPQVRKIIIGLGEASAGEVQIQFDMPDATEVAEACGVIAHQR